MSDKAISWEEAVLWLKGHPEKKELVRACFYDDPIETSAERFYHSSEWKAVKKILASAPRAKVLDVGAGRGISSYAFARDGCKVTSLEPDPSDVVGAGAIRQVIQPGLDITIEEEKGEKLPFPANSFDVVYGRAVLHHADDLRTFCREVARVLKPTGVFLFTREHVISKSEDLDIFLNNHPLHFLYKGECAYKLAEYCESFRVGGLRCDEILGPFSSDINLFPSSQGELFKRIRKELKVPIPRWLIKVLLIPRMNKNDQTPGRLYSFFGKKI